MNKLLSSLGLTLMLAFTLTGCELYFGKHNGGGDDGNPPGWSCESNADCAAGCYCEKQDGATSSGECSEAGFCDNDADCPDGYVCDDRQSCVPGDKPTPCSTSSDCAAGSICGPGGLCEPSCVCNNDADAQAAGWHHCDEARNTCENGYDFTCAGPATCGTEPTCPQGGIGLVDSATGCWTGECGAIVGCDVTPSCAMYQHEADCFDPANGSCTASYTGINCTKLDGSACQSGDMGCTCEYFVFSECR